MMASLVHLAVLLVLPPLLLGVIQKTKALFAGRRGPPLLQAYWDLGKLFRKDLVLSTTTTWVFVAGPVAGLAALLLAALLLPLGSLPALVGFRGDLVLFAYLLGLARFCTTSAALDTGSSFEGMGSSRELSFAVLAEPALFLGLLTLARITGSLRLGALLDLPALGSVHGTTASLILLALGLFIVLLAETCRIPVDDPATHLELTMIHEAMVLDHSGPLLGLVLYASSLKLLVLSSILVRVAAPIATGSPLLDLLAALGETLALAAGIGVVESVMARLRLRRVPALLVAAILLCGSAFILIVR